MASSVTWARLLIFHCQTPRSKKDQDKDIKGLAICVCVFSPSYCPRKVEAKKNGRILAILSDMQERIVADSVGSGFRLSEFESQSHHLQAKRQWLSSLISSHLANWYSKIYTLWASHEDYMT